MSSSYETSEPDREKEEQVLNLLEGSDPVAREDLEDSLDFDEETTQSVIREMLYSGQLATTPDWKYEKRDE
jgi:hypothetical protein